MKPRTGRWRCCRWHDVAVTVPFIVLVPFVAPGTAVAAERDVKRIGLEITPFAGYRFGGEFDSVDDDDVTGSLDLDEAGSLGLIVNFPADPSTEWEIFYSRQKTQLDSAGLFSPGEPVVDDLTVTYLHAGGTYLFEGERVLPYIVATIGASRFDPDAAGFDAETYFSFAIGSGLKLAPTSRIGLRLEGRFFGSLVDSDEAIFCRADPEGSRCLVAASGGILWQFEALAGVIFRF